MHEAQVHTLPMAGPHDVSAVAQLLDSGTVQAADVVALIAQTEGDGHARGYAALCLALLFAKRLGLALEAVQAGLPMLMIGGTAGLMNPHVTLFVRKPGQRVPDGPPRLAIGVSSTRELLPHEMGTRLQVQLVADAVRAAMQDAGIAVNADVACVQLKCPQSTLASTEPAHSRGASALGAAVALGEVELDAVSDSTITQRSDLYSERASASSGNEQVAVRVVVLGNVAGAPGSYLAAAGVMTHALDLAGAHATFKAANLDLQDGVVTSADRKRVAAVFVNAGADSRNDWLGQRHTLQGDLLGSYSGHVAKALAHNTVAAIAQNTLLLASAGAEHQGQPGSNLLCVIARQDQTTNHPS